MANEGAAQGHHVFRVIQILTLIPAWALMAAVVSWYNSHNVDTPGGVLTLFITTLLASVWAFCILIAVLRAGNTAYWIAFWDIVAMGALIAGVATTSKIANIQCSGGTRTTVYVTAEGIPTTNVDQRPTNTDINNYPWDDRDANLCNLIKAAWGLAIANIIMFFITAMLAIAVCRQNEAEMKRDTIIVEDPPVVEKVYTDPMGYPGRPRRARRSHHSRSSRSPRPRSYSRTYHYDEPL